jgi:hypothetical protein
MGVIGVPFSAVSCLLTPFVSPPIRDVFQPKLAATPEELGRYAHGCGNVVALAGSEGFASMCINASRRIRVKETWTQPCTL